MSKAKRISEELAEFIEKYGEDVVLQKLRPDVTTIPTEVSEECGATKQDRMVGNAISRHRPRNMLNLTKLPTIP